MDTPEFDLGEIKTSLESSDRHKPVVKVGMTTGITKGFLHVNGTSVRVSDIDLTLD